MTGDRIAAITRFLDTAVLAYFGLPENLPSVVDSGRSRA